MRPNSESVTIVTSAHTAPPPPRMLKFFSMMGMMVVSASTTVLADSIICLRTTSFYMARATASKEAVACALSVVCIVRVRKAAL